MTAGPGLLNVIAAGRRPAPDEPVIVDVAALLRADEVAVRTLGDTDAGELPQAVLSTAGGLSGPVLVLGMLHVPHRLQHVRRILVPFDRTWGETGVIGQVVNRALELGLTVDQLHVLTAATRPMMWDGPGHHAEAWHDELRRRHQVGTATVTVRSGSPGAVIGARAGANDLLVVCWNGRTAAHRATVLRDLLGHSPAPLLLVRSGQRVVADASAAAR